MDISVRFASGRLFEGNMPRGGTPTRNLIPGHKHVHARVWSGRCRTNHGGIPQGLVPAQFVANCGCLIDGTSVMSLPTAIEILEGSKVHLRRFRETDVTDTYLAWLNDPLVVRFSNQRFRTHDRASSVRYLESFSNTGNLFLCVTRKDDGRAIGTMTAYISKPHGTADIGIMIGETSIWGQGFGQDAWDTLIAWLLDKGGIRKVTAGTLASNHSMIKLMQRSGMQFEAVRKHQEIVEGRPEDIVYFAKFAQRSSCSRS
jgi:[ribosomal protein S5]-alanine N-acetyltransferase